MSMTVDLEKNSMAVEIKTELIEVNNQLNTTGGSYFLSRSGSYTKQKVALSWLEKTPSSHQLEEK